MRTFLISFFLAFAAVTAKADMTVAQYESGMQTPRTAELVKLYVFGLGDGITRANQIQGRAPFYCTPSNEPVGPETYLDLINLEIEAYNSQMSAAEVAKLSVGMLLLKGFQEVFPCAGE
jgi:hypothetical protein